MGLMGPVVGRSRFSNMWVPFFPFLSMRTTWTDLSYTIGIFALLIIIVLIQVIVSSKLLLVALLLLHSFWIPQIVRNARKGTRRALRKRYVFGTSLARMYFPLCEFRGLDHCVACSYSRIVGGWQMRLPVLITSYLPSQIVRFFLNQNMP
jgi:hypothetical protein